MSKSMHIMKTMRVNNIVAYSVVSERPRKSSGLKSCTSWHGKIRGQGPSEIHTLITNTATCLQVKGEPSKRASQILSIQIKFKKNTIIAVFLSIYDIVCWKLMLESRKNMAMSAAILTAYVSWTQLVCVAAMCITLWANLFLLYIGKEQAKRLHSAEL